ncbi:MAG: DUF4249 family protein [Hyphomicrobiales bacterium]
MRRRFAAACVRVGAVALVALATGCSTERNPRDLFAPGEVGTIVVDATMVVDRRFPVVTVRRTLAPDQPYSSSAAAVTGADVRIETPGGGWMAYSDLVSPLPGTYRATGGFGDSIPPATVQPNTTYRLVVRTQDGRTVTATTTTPSPFHARDWLLLDDPSLEIRRRLRTFDDYPTRPDSVYLAPENQIVYQDGLLEARFDRGDALAFQVGFKNLEFDSPLLVHADFLSEHDLESLSRDSSSPPLDAATGAIRVPWLAIFFAGRCTIRIFSIDRNWYDLERSLPEIGGTNLGFGTNAGENFDRPIFHVQGGIGLFGSASVDSVGIDVLPPS